METLPIVYVEIMHLSQVQIIMVSINLGIFSMALNISLWLKLVLI